MVVGHLPGCSRYELLIGLAVLPEGAYTQVKPRPGRRILST